MLANVISQTILDEVIGNSEDSLPNKIKEKEESLQNTLNNRLSIPMLSIAQEESTNEEANTFVSSTESQVENGNNINKMSDESGNGFDLTNFSDTKVFEGNEKPINVKEHMIMNMIKKYSNLFVADEPEVEQVIENEEHEDIVEEESINESPINTEPERSTVESEAIEYGMPENIEKILVNTVDFDTTVVAINETRQKYKNVAELANRAEKDAEESAKLLEKISNEYTEAEKQLKEKELRSKAMEQKILSLLNNEQDRLSKQLQEKESVINSAKKRKEENNDKIVDFKTKISSTLEKSNEYDAMISRQEELLNTLAEFDTDFNDPVIKNTERRTSKIV